MGYELYRQLANQRPRRRKVKGGTDCIDLEEEDRNKLTLDGKLSKNCCSNKIFKIFKIFKAII